MDKVGKDPGPRLFTSNRLEVLAEHLAEILEVPLSSPLVAEVVVVQSKGMERWISMQLARKHGICANFRFPFPNAILDELCTAIAATTLENVPFEPEFLRWRLMKVIPECLKQKEFEEVRNYLKGDSDGLKLFQLAQRVANTFDEYVVFRPDSVLEWERGKGNHWQAVLWRRLVGHEAGLHRAAIRQKLLREIDRLDRATDGFPERISVFGISTLPRFHLEVLDRVSRLIPVYLFLLNPCQEYWGNIVSRREARKIRRNYKARGGHPSDLHLEKGNGLLASLGTLGRDFFDLVYTFDYQEVDLFEGSSEDTLLACIQHDIFMLYERGEEQNKKAAVNPEDNSLQVHSCHSPMREVEVLFDCLLGMFGDDSTLQPEDIIVMMPSIEEYTPFIQAVFDMPPSEELRIPYNITDRTMRSGSRLASSFLGILDLCRSRFRASDIIALLESEPVYTAFGLMESDVELIKHWVDVVGIRWGIDETTRQDQGLPPYDDHTWKSGFERLLLGYALPGEDKCLFEGILPFDHIEGDETATMGKFIDFAKTLFSIAGRLEEPRSLNDWSKTLTDILSRFFATSGEGERELRVLYRIVNELAEQGEIANFDGTVDLMVIKAYIRQQCEKRSIGSGFMSGGVTFCTLLPMRSIPFSTICLLGMSNSAYPRKANPTSFDLIAQHPRPGDPSRRNDDRYLFLEAVLSARKILYISYVGQSFRDNSAIPPSVVVSELLDYVEAGFTDSTDSIIDHVVKQHPLQSFSPRYFRGGGGLFSYSKENCVAAQRSLQKRNVATPYIPSALSCPGEEWRAVSVDALCRFFKNPAQFLLTNRLGLYLKDETSVVIDREPFEIEGLEKYTLEQHLLDMNLSRTDLKRYYSVVRASGLLPPGSVGAFRYKECCLEVERFAAHVSRFLQGAAPESVTIDVEIGQFRITGTIKNLFSSGLISYRYASVKPKDNLAAWIKHLALNQADSGRGPLRSFYLGLNDGEPVAFTFSPLSAASSKDLLTNLLESYWAGLREPLHFFPVSSWEYADAVLNKKKSRPQGLDIARRKWQGSGYARGEKEDLYYQQCFSMVDPLDDLFESAALNVLGSLFEHREEFELTENV